MKTVKRWGPPLLLLAPSLLLVGVFVYGLIVVNLQTSLTDSHTAQQATGQAPTALVGAKNYLDLLGSPDFQHSLKNLLLYTAVFLVGTMVIGFVWAWLLERPVRGEGFFRSVYLFPMAVSFIASGVVWRWLLNSNEGESALGLNRLFQMVGLDFLQNPWWNNISVGIAAIAIPAIWQLSGYVMALFLAGFRGIPEELREAAVVDGTTTYQLYRHVLFPQLTPVALSALIIAGHMSMKMFDLIMSVSGPQYITEVPAVYVWQTLLTSDQAKAAAISIFLLLVVAAVIVPYLIYINRAEKTR